ncbi:MAG: hypothetical protein GY719_02290 [bacterium]|nr:hypothetical protein [bacterium]
MKNPSAPEAADLPLWKKALFSLLATVLFFTLLEAGLAVAGIGTRPALEDPFLGFASSASLFVEGTDADGQPVLTTAAGKRGFFNVQQFRRDKPPGTYRVFCLGGSTTYGRPYSDATSFCGWLRELLSAADPKRDWEVVNAGGISYASYRVARVMDELAGYEPDLFVVYTGHNEFLEERTYGNLRDLPGVVKSVVGVLARTRIWAAASALYDRVRTGTPSAGRSRQEPASILPGEVRAKLDHSIGPDLYERDDALRDGILEHYRFSLRRMVRAARAAGAEVLLVTPASNLKDCSPFKSQHTDELDDSQRVQSQELLAAARQQMREARWGEARESLDEALAFDARFAELYYRRGEALLAVGLYDEAEAAFTGARDEDVCPLRALSPMTAAVAEVARAADAPVVDFVGLVAGRTRSEHGHGIAGEELFLDHVHPTIEGHRLLAVALLEALIERGTVRPRAAWGERAIAEVAARVEGAIEPELHARALANLALTLDWAGKAEESRRLALRALESGEEDPTILMIAARHLAADGKSDEALELFRRAMRANPNNPVIQSQLGMLLTGRRELEAAAAHFFLASILWVDNDAYQKQLASVMTQRGRYAVALRCLLEARRLSPGDPNLETRISALRERLGGETPALGTPVISATRYASGYPRTIAQTQTDATGREVVDGIWTEWFDGGRLKRFVDYSNGVPDGVSVTWDENGEVLDRRQVRHGEGR